MVLLQTSILKLLINKVNKLQQRVFHSVHSVQMLWVHCTFFIPGDLDFWPWHSNSSERRTKRVNLVQICSAVPAIHCQIRVPRIELISTISHIWHINGHQTITINFGISGPRFTKFLYDVDRSSVLLLMRRFPILPSVVECESQGERRVTDFVHKIGCHRNIPWPIRKLIPDWTSTPTCLPSLKIWWRSVL